VSLYSLLLAPHSPRDGQKIGHQHDVGQLAILRKPLTRAGARLSGRGALWPLATASSLSTSGTL